MPPVRSARNRIPPPDGFDDIEDTLLEFSNKMKDAENASHEGKKRNEVLWPIFQITHQRKKRDILRGCFITPLISSTDLPSRWQVHAISTISITIRRLSQSSFTIGCSRMATQTPIWLRNGRNKAMKRWWHTSFLESLQQSWLLPCDSSVAWNACKPKKQTSMLRVSVEFRKLSSKKIKS